jgi:ATP-dependent DNA helicase RecG
VLPIDRKAAVIEQQPSAVSNSQGLQQSGDNSKPRSLTEEIQHMQQLVVPAVDETAQEVTPEKTLAELDSVDEDQIATETSPEISVPETPIRTVKSESNVRKVTMEYVDQCLDLLQKLEQPVNALPGVGPKTEQALTMLGLFTLRDLLFHFPRSFVDRSVIESDIRNVPDGELGTFVLTVHRDQAKHNAVPCSDEAGNNVDIVFMYGKTRHFATAEKKKLLQSNKMVVSGKVSCSKSGYAIFNPDVIELVNNATDVLGIEPVYRLNSGLAQNKMRKIVDVALEVADELKILPESLPEDILEDLDWPSFVDAIKIAHKPTSMDGTGVNSPARNRLAFEELCMQQAQLALARWDMKYHGIEQQCISRAKTWRDSPLVAKAVQSLPFQLTESQMNCLDEIWNDAIVSNDGGRMTRLLQGDVGSGKTVLGYLAGLGCIESRQGGGSVVVMLAPTQLLALQHYRTVLDFANAFNEQYADSLNMGIRVELLTGSVVGSRREEVFSRLEDTGSDAVFLIGTHALVTTDVVERLRNLPSVIQSNDKGVALAIIDEEQRFGVNQRQALSSCAANTLFMTATPIPRSLGLHNSGLLDVTHLESEPRNVQTTITSTDNLEKVVSVLQTKIKNGSRCFWVLPRIGGNETDNDEDTSSGPSSVLDRHSMLTDIFGTETIGHVHGRMSVKDRETQLAKFSDTSSPTSILVSTTCIEVGIDIRDVDILIVENADRFGLSALHQLRGRIGRGSSDVNCHCILIAEEKHFNDSSSDSIKRLDILRETLSGEQVSAYDFEFRGPGDLMGRAQTGLLKGKAVNPEYHLDMLDAATWIGRAFSGVLSGGPVQNESSASQCSVLMKKLCTGELRSFYDQTSASSEQGFALRVMMALFANYQDDAGGGILQSIT